MVKIETENELQVTEEIDEWEILACEFLLEERKFISNKTCSACGEDLLPDQFLICSECLEMKSQNFFKWAVEFSSNK